MPYEPDAAGRLICLVRQQVRRRRVEPDGVASSQNHDIEADRDLELALEQIPVLRASVLEHPLVVGGCRMRGVEDPHEVETGPRVRRQLLPDDSGVHLETLALAGSGDRDAWAHLIMRPCVRRGSEG